MNYELIKIMEAAKPILSENGFNTFETALRAKQAKADKTAPYEVSVVSKEVIMSALSMHTSNKNASFLFNSLLEGFRDMGYVPLPQLQEAN